MCSSSLWAVQHADGSKLGAACFFRGHRRRATVHRMTNGVRDRGWGWGRRDKCGVCISTLSGKRCCCCCSCACRVSAECIRVLGEDCVNVKMEDAAVGHVLASVQAHPHRRLHRLYRLLRVGVIAVTVLLAVSSLLLTGDDGGERRGERWAG